MNKNRILDKIKYYKITFTSGTAVKLFRRKRNGYPKHIEDNKVYYVYDIESDDKLLVVDDKKYLTLAYPTYPKTKKVHKYYMIPINIMREEKLKDFFNDNKQT